MPLTIELSAAEIAALTRVAHLLAAPLDHPSTDAWRAAVNQALKHLLGADSAGFLLPSADGPPLLSAEHDPAELARYPDLHPPPLADGTSVWQHMVAVRVATLSTAYGPDLPRYHRSAYFNEFAAPNGARHTLAAMLPLDDGEPHPLRLVSVQLWRDGQGAVGAREFGDRERCMLGLLVPSLAAGIAAIRHWERHRAAMLGVIDALGQAVLVCGARGHVVHQTPELTAVLGADPEAAALLHAMRRAAGFPEAERSRLVASLIPGPRVIDVRTARARYRACATRYGASAGEESLVLVSLQRLTSPPPTPSALRQVFGLTAAEARVALFLADGMTNAQIAQALGVSASTARRHTEHVLTKLGVHSRAAVSRRLATLD